FAAIFTSSQGSGMRAVNGGARPVNLVCGLQFVQQHKMQRVPNTGVLEFLQVIQAGHAATVTQFRSELLPRNSRLEHKDTPRHNLASVQRLTAGVTTTPWLGRRQQRFQAVPQGIANNWMSHGTPPFVGLPWLSPAARVPNGAENLIFLGAL